MRASGPGRTIVSPRASTFLGALLAIVAPLVVHIRVVAGLAHFTFDYDGYHYPIAVALYEGFPDVAQWDRYSYGGIALSSNLQSAAFHPPQILLFSVLKVLGFASLPEAAFAWVNLLNFVVLSLGTFFLARYVSRSTGTGVIAAVLVSVSGAVIGQAQHMGVVGALSATPFAVWCVVACGDSKSWHRVGWSLGLCAALGYSLSAGFISQFIAVAGVVGVVAVAVSIADRHSLARRLGTLAVASGSAFLLNAGVVASFLFAPDMIFRINTKPAVRLEQLVSVFSPDAFGLIDWPATDGTPDPTLHFAWGGFAFLPLLVAAILSRPGRRDVALLVSAVVVIVLAVTPVISGVGALGGFLEAVRPYVFIAPAFIILCVVASGAWTRRSALRGKRLAALIGTTLATFAVLVVADGFVSVRLVPLAPLLITSAVFALVLVLTLSRLPVLGAALLCGLVLVEGVVTTGRARFIEAPNDQVVSTAPYNDPELLAILLSRPGLSAADSEVMGGDWNGWWSVWHVPSSNGFQPTFSRYWDEASEAASTWRDDRRFSFDRFKEGLPQQLGISTYVTGSEEAAKLIDEMEGIEVSYNNYGTAVLTIPGATPLFSWAPSGDESVALDATWESSQRVHFDLPCETNSGQLVLIGQYDARWTLTLDGTIQSRGVQSAGATTWDIDACGSARLEFVDRPFLVGNALAAMSALILASLSVLMAWRVSRRRS
jgi:hypothetical protein